MFQLTSKISGERSIIMPKTKEYEKTGVISLEEPESVQAEMHRLIRTRLEYASIDSDLKIINITSSTANEAKTTTACNLAVVLANKLSRVLLIDLDLRNPSCHRAFKVKNELGITDMLVDYAHNGDELDKNKYLNQIKHPNIVNELYLLTAGTQVINTTEIIGSNKMKDLLKFLKQYFDMIIIDSAPSGVVVDGIITSTLSDGTIFVLESNRTKIDVAQKAVNQLRNFKINLLGVVLTKTKYKARNYNGYSYYYYYRDKKASNTSKSLGKDK